MDDTHDEKGKPEAVNLERDEPISTAARRRDSFGPGERIPERARIAEADARAAGRAGGASETTASAQGGVSEQRGATYARRPQAGELRDDE